MLGTEVRLWGNDDGSERQRWFINPANMTGLGESGTELDSLEHSMARIARAVYDFPLIGTGVSGWRIAKQIKQQDGLTFLAMDKISIYQRDDICAFAISGSSDAPDWIDNLNFLPKHACGVDVHSGFYNEYSHLKSTSQFQELADYMSSSECDGGRYIVGHGMGGAVASVFAGCMEHENPFGGNWDLDGLFTFGAPGVSKPAMDYKGGCVPGKRFYNHDLIVADPVPWVTSIIGLRHPKMEANRFRNFLGKSLLVYGCDVEDTTLKPWGLLKPFSPMHLMTGGYIYRADKLLV